MKRKDFYIEYYNRTNRNFSDKIVWSKAERKEAWQKGQHLFSKYERKGFIVTQYLILLLCWIPACFERRAWVVVPIAVISFILQSIITDFSIIKIELLYSIYRKDNIYCSMLHDMFLGNSDSFLDKLKRSTNKKVMGYVCTGGGKFYKKYCAACRNKNDQITIIFKRNRVVVMISKKTFVIEDISLDKDHLIAELAVIINANN